MDTVGLNETVGTPESAPRGNPLLLPNVGWRTAVADIGLVALFLVVEGVVLNAWYWHWSVTPMRTPEMRVKGWMAAVTVASVAVLGLAALLTWVAGLRPDALGIRRDEPERQIAWGIGGAVVSWFALLGWLRIVVVVQRMLATFVPHGWLWTSTHTHPYVASAKLFGLGTALTLFVIPVLAEEVLFRGLLLPRLRRLTGNWWSAVLLCSVAFAWYHRAAGFSVVVSTFIGSLILCFTFIRSRSLLAACLAHFLYNATIAWFVCGQ